MESIWFRRRNECYRSNTSCCLWMRFACCVSNGCFLLWNQHCLSKWHCHSDMFCLIVFCQCDVPNHDSCPNHMNNYYFSWMRFGKNVLTPCRNFIKPHYGLANFWIRTVDFLKSWMHSRAPDATVSLIGKRNRALDYALGLTDYCYNVADAQIDDWCQQCNWF